MTAVSCDPKCGTTDAEGSQFLCSDECFMATIRPAHMMRNYAYVDGKHRVTCSCGKTASSAVSVAEARSAWYRHRSRAEKAT